MFKIFLILVLVALVKCKNDNGFGTHYNWKNSVYDAVREGVRTKKPVMVIIHKSWCQWTKKLKPMIANSREIFALSKNFIMVNTNDNDEPRNKALAPDGGYYPRIIFIYGKKVLRGVTNGAPKDELQYEYSDENSIINAMEEAIRISDLRRQRTK